MKHITVEQVLTRIVVALVIGLSALVGSSVAQLACPDPILPEKPDTLGSLKGVPVPLPAALDTVVKNRAKAIVLGKALFWDKQVGSNGQACASCHFHAGADNRIKNQLNPGGRAYPPDTYFDYTGTGGWGPNYTLKSGDFPFHVLSDPLDRNSSVVFDMNDVASSQGAFGGTFLGLNGLNFETCKKEVNPLFYIYPSGKLVRKAPERNAPTTINAIFQFRTFWDGRANNHYNGVNPFGRRDPNARVYEVQGSNVVPVVMDLENAALASQADGPPGSDTEMACAGRAFSMIGRKMIGLPKPLVGQQVDSTDSVLGPYADPVDGLNPVHSYRQLIQDSFHDKYWNAPGYVSPDGFTLMEKNFSMFFGLSIMLYESTLISDDAPFDRYAGNATTPPDFTALTAAQINGMSLFIGKGKCVNCHKGPDFTGAGVRSHAEFQEGGIVERMHMGDNGVALYDNGFYNIGARPTGNDLGVGAFDPFFKPLSFTRQYKKRLGGENFYAPDPFQINTCTFEVGACQPVANWPPHRDAVDGAFKTPSLRNAELTGPYMHHGGMATLEQVVAFYNRGGDRRGPNGNDTTGWDANFWGQNNSNLDPDITPLGLTDQEQADIVAFIKSLTDERVRCERAPFDHPALKNFNGHVGDYLSVKDMNRDGKADDQFVQIPAVGAGGLPAKGLACLQPFHAGLQ